MSQAQSWTDETRSSARELQQILLTVARAAEDAGVDAVAAEHMLAPYRELLESVYERDLALAKLIDRSDLLLHVHGPAASAPAPRVSVLTNLLSRTRDEVTRLAKHIGGVSTVRVPASLDMGLVGLAEGSLFIGFSAAAGAEESSSLTREAVNVIGSVSGLVASEATLGSISAQVTDPATRDMAVAAVRHLSPSGQIGINAIDILGRGMKRSVALSTDTRRTAKRLMSESPKAALEHATFIGTVREVDLDAGRFEIRNIDGQAEDVRCAHELREEEVQLLMNKRVRVRGKAELGSRGTVRMLWVDDAELIES